MEGVSTSTAGFIGLSERGPIEGAPQLVTSFADFRRKYGSYLSAAEFGEYRFLSYAVEHFFINGGARAFVMRVAPSNAQCAKGAAPAEGEAILAFSAIDPGLWGDNLRIILTPASKARTQIFEVLTEADGSVRYRVKNSVGFNAGDVVCFLNGKEKVYNRVTKSQDNIITLAKPLEGDVVDKNLVAAKTLTTCEFNVEVKFDDQVELYEQCSFNISAPNYVEKKMTRSDLVQVVCTPPAGETVLPPFATLAGDDEKAVVSVIFSGGSNGSADKVNPATFMGEDKGPGKRTGIQSFIDNDVVSIIAVPGVTDPNVQLTLVAHCENTGARFAVLDMPQPMRKVQDLTGVRDIFDSEYAAMYHPWLEVFDPLDKKNIAIPPSGSVMGIYARSDNTRGVHKAPANEPVRACVGLDCIYSKGEQDILNPKGVNLIRSFPGQGIRVWGARTVSSNSLWRYINVRRLFIFVEETIKANTNWVVFEPNDELLWVRVKRTIEVFLTNLWRGGALAGASAGEAFFVDVGPNTMTQDDIDNGRLICVIGVAPVKPAEFVIFRITQKTSDSAGE